MARADLASIARTLEQEARRRFVRWDGRTWEELVEGPARRLEKALSAASGEIGAKRALLESYLRLGCEGIGLGYLLPAALGADNFFSRAFRELLPDGLAALPEAARASVLADCFNLGENLASESTPAWMRRIFERVLLKRLTGGASLAELGALVADIEGKVGAAPEGRLTAKPFSIDWIHLGEDDPRFLPGPVHFVAPTVVCVHDRQRGGGDPVTVGVWLESPPIVIGSLGCRAAPPQDPGLDLALLEALSRRDPRAVEWLAMARNDWRAAVTLVTSQFLVALRPA